MAGAEDATTAAIRQVPPDGRIGLERAGFGVRLFTAIIPTPRRNDRH